MNKKITKDVLSVVVPVYNESKSLLTFHASLLAVLATLHDIQYEIIYCNDGSTDESLRILHQIADEDHRVRVLAFARNFGKEIALTAGIDLAEGDAIITLDADGQHPVERIPEFIALWHSGARVVVGVRGVYSGASFLKRMGSGMFYRVLKSIGGVTVVPRSTDFRLIDKSVQEAFRQMPERNRMTRGLIDWIGFEQKYIAFDAANRIAGLPAYSLGKLVRLAIDSIVSLSTRPLYISIYIGFIVLPFAGILGLLMLLNAVFGDPFSLHITGTAYIAVLLLLLVGLLLVTQGVIGIYLSHIHAEAQGRPLYIIDGRKSRRVT